VKAIPYIRKITKKTALKTVINPVEKMKMILKMVLLLVMKIKTVLRIATVQMIKARRNMMINKK